MLDRSTHATFLPGEPGRTARLALWPADGVTGAAAEAELGVVALAVSSRDRIRAARMTAHLVPISQVLDELVQLAPDAPVSRSVAAWGHVARVAVGLAARGRLQPAIVSGRDTWVLAPLTEHDRQVRAALAAWIPPEAHCLVVADDGTGGPGPSPAARSSAPGSDPLTMLAPTAAVSGFYGAVADTLPRTAAAGIASGLPAWAGEALADVAALERFLPAADAGERTIVGLRVAMPAEPDDPFGIDLQLRSAIDPSLVVDAAALWEGDAAGFGPEAKTDLLLALRRGARLWPPLERLLAETCPTSLELDDHEAIDLFGPLATDLAGAGVEVLIPSSLTRTLEARAHVEPPPGAADGAAHFDLATACELSWRGVLGGEPLDESELSALARSRRPLVRLRGEWVVVDPTVVAKLGRRDSLSGTDALVAALSGTAEIDGEVVAVEVGGATADLARRLEAASAPHELDEPPGLDATLRPYQRRGLAWMNEMVDLGLGGVLADDMGLGKTIQLIALHLHRMGRAPQPSGQEQQPTLVVCPATLVGNWQHELRRFAPGLQVHRYHGADRDLADIGPTDVVITTYGIARRDHPELADQPWGLVVADEAQQIKNPNASVSKAMRHLPAGARLALTGTPVENRLTELWSLLDWTTPGLLGGVEAFRRNVAIPIERDRDPEVTARFARIVSPFLLRRRKDDPEVAPDLPPKTETDHPVVLTEEQAGLYRAVVEEILDAIDKAEGIARRGLVLKLLT
ncbi:MAG: DEAD/DEAH box helicase, partial [Acidimicrobiales bacterium]